MSLSVKFIHCRALAATIAAAARLHKLRLPIELIHADYDFCTLRCWRLRRKRIRASNGPDRA
jgi:hypothetical protein